MANQNQGGGSGRPPAPPGYAPVQQPGGAPAQGAPPQQQGGYPPAPGYPQQGYGGYPQGQPQPLVPNDPLGLGMPANAWFPGALVSFFFPGLGLLFVPRSEIKTLGVKIFVGYLAASIG